MKRTFVCASSRIKHYVQPFIRLPWDACSRMFVLSMFILREKLLNKLQKFTGTGMKNIFLNEQKVGMLLQKRADTRGVGISIEEIYIPPYNHTH